VFRFWEIRRRDGCLRITFYGVENFEDFLPKFPVFSAKIPEVFHFSVVGLKTSGGGRMGLDGERAVDGCRLVEGNDHR
jgi:hypothetical protein